MQVFPAWAERLLSRSRVALFLDKEKKLFKVGHGELVASGGVRESVDLFSHLNNDTVITSPSKNFEISSGARMQLLVGIRK